MAPIKKKNSKAGKAAVVAKKHTWQPGNTVVVLKNMKDRKNRSWIGHRAVVLEDNHPWYTVQPVVGVETLKWRKEDTRFAYKIDEKRHDPAEILSIEVWSKVFSFLVDDRLDSVHTCHSHLRSVSKLWKDVFDQNMKKWDGLVNVSLGSFVFSPVSSPMKISWITENHIHLKELDISNAIYDDIPILKGILTKCHTDRMTKLDVEVSGYRRDFSVFQTQTEREPRCESLKEFHDTIANECPNLVDLDVTLTLPAKSPCYDGYISKTLFSISSIENLSIRLEYMDGDTDPEDSSVKLECRVFTNLIENLPGLKRLNPRLSHQPVSRHTRYHIESSSLLSIDASSLPPANYLSCKCPKLERFVCRGNEHGNGVAPKMPVGGWKSLRKADNDHFLALPRQTIDVPFFQVPGTCEVVLTAMFDDVFVDQCYYELSKSARYTTWKENEGTETC